MSIFDKINDIKKNLSSSKSKDIEDEILIEEVEEKKQTKIQKFEKKVKSQIIKNVIFIQIKAWLAWIFMAMLPYLLVVIWALFVSFIALYSFFFYVNYEHYKYINDLNNKTNSSWEQVNLSDYLKNWRKVFTSTDAKNFNSTSPIPHWFPMSWKLVQNFCSNFYTSENWIVYDAHKWNYNWKLYHEDYCEQQMKNTKEYSDFAITYAWWDWTKIWAHGWVDISSKTWTPVLSMVKWRIVKVWKDWVWGNFIDIQSINEKYIIRYWHLSKVISTRGEEVLAWQKVAESWNTWLSTWPHLHYSICYNEDNLSSFNCYSSNTKSILLDPFVFSFNFEINWEETIWDLYTFSDSFIWTQIKSWVGSPWKEIKYTNYNQYIFNWDETISPDIQDYIYIKVWNEENVHPLILKTLHYRERWWRLTNPEPKNEEGWSWQNEGVYWFYSDFSKLSPLCNRTIENFWWFWEALTYREFENQTYCAAKAIKYKSNQQNAQNYISVNEFDLSENNWDNLCLAISGWNQWRFYCYNRLYPTYSNNSEYTDMPVYTWWKLLNYNKQDWFLKFALDNFTVFSKIIEDYSNKNI